jgi:hypothetical protein
MSIFIFNTHFTIYDRDGGNRNHLRNPTSKLEPLIGEADQLISIFVTSIKTAKQNKRKGE